MREKGIEKLKLRSELVKATKRQLNSMSLREDLWQTLQKLKSRTIKVNEANAISQVGRSILSSIALELEASRITNSDLTNSTQDFLGVKNNKIVDVGPARIVGRK